MLAQSTIEQVKAYDDIVGIISNYVPLKKKGRNHTGLCPFHSEKTPSFVVSPEKQIWHCFGCHASGDSIGFVMKIDSLGFYEAVVKIANTAGIEVKEEHNSKYTPQDEKNRKNILDMLFFTREYFKKNLQKNKTAIDYLTARKVDQTSIDNFHIGFAPQSSELEKEFLNKGYSHDLLSKSGLFFKKDNNSLVPKFRNRIIFPILDYMGRTVGFGGRIMEQIPNVAKYLNSEESSLFNKRKLLYGLNQASASIKEKKFVILMEGYMDVVISHQFGFTNALATMGTALTNDQIYKLKRFTNTIYLAMDSDEAGQKAIEQSYELLKQHNFEIKVINFSAKDPADTLLEKGVTHFQQAIDNANSMVDFKLNRLLQIYDTSKIEDISKILDSIIPILKLQKDIVLERYFINRIATRLSINEELVMAKLKKNQYNIRRNLSNPIKNKKTKFILAEEYLIYLLASNIAQRKIILDKIRFTEFNVQEHKNLVQLISSLNTDLVNKELVESVTEPELKKKLSFILIEHDDNNNNLQDCINTVKDYKLDQRINDIKKQIIEQDSQGNEENITKLQQEYSELQKNKKKNLGNNI